MKIIDMRSDTQTKPTEEMRQAMAEADMGDDTVRESAAVNRLEEMSAEMMGKEAALFVASTTMGNVLGVLTHCNHGDEVIMGSQAHMFRNEQNGAAILAGAQTILVPNDAEGRMEPEDVAAAIRPKGNAPYPATGLICMENTHTSCNGSVITPEHTKEIVDLAHANGIPVHLDGARIFNAAVHLEMPASELVGDVDDVVFGLSKGLSAPEGSLLCGSQEYIDKARRWRRMIGGGWRQVGPMAAAGIVALKSMIPRLAEDNARGRRLAQGLAQIPGIVVDAERFQTNIVFVEVPPSTGSIHEFMGRLAQEGLKASYPDGHRFRLCTGRHIDDEDVDMAIDRVAKVAREMQAANSG